MSKPKFYDWDQTKWFSGFLLVLALALGGCGGGGGGGTDPAAAVVTQESGELIIGLTDAEGDFVSYTVDVLAITLERLDGAQVEALPLNTRVDFAELTEVTEFLTVATVPAGVYESVSLTLDYSAAEILVQGDDGEALPAEARDSSGELLDQVSVRLTLTSSDVIRIRPGIPAAFSLDFDLDASNDIDLSVNPVVVTVAPFLLATPELESDREHRLRGLLAETDPAASTITLKVRPFRHRSGAFGEFTFQVTDDTVYEVDGVGLVGEEGLRAVSALAENTPIIGHGEVNDGRYVADILLAGTSVPWTHSDVVKGVVSARIGNELTVRGARIEYADGIHIVRDTVTVTLGPDTVFSAPGLQVDLLGEQSVSVGQRVTAFGQLNRPAAGLDTGDNLQLDVTEGRVRLNMSSFVGEVVSADPLVVDLTLLSGRRPSSFDFSGTGVTSENDADPDFYQVATSSLPLGTVVDDEMIRVRGLVNEFGAAPDDFLARSVLTRDLAVRPAIFAAAWPEAGTMPVLNLDDLSVELALTQARFALKVLGQQVVGSEDLESLILSAPGSGRGVYAVRVRGEGEIHLFRNFADLTAQLLVQLDAGKELRRTTAHGRYNGAEQLETVRASFEFTTPADQ